MKGHRNPLHRSGGRGLGAPLGPKGGPNYLSPGEQATLAELRRLAQDPQVEGGKRIGFIKPSGDSHTRSPGLVTFVAGATSRHSGTVETHFATLRNKGLLGPYTPGKGRWVRLED